MELIILMQVVVLLLIFWTSTETKGPSELAAASSWDRGSSVCCVSSSNQPDKSLPPLDALDKVAVDEIESSEDDDVASPSILPASFFDLGVVMIHHETSAEFVGSISFSHVICRLRC